MQFFVQNIPNDDNDGGKVTVSQPNDTKDSVCFDNSRYDAHTIFAHVGDQRIPIVVAKNPTREVQAKMAYLLQSLLRLDIWFDHWAAKSFADLETHNQLAMLEVIIDDALVIRSRKEHILELQKHYGRRG